MAVQYNQNKDAAKRLFRELIFSPNLAMLFVMNEKGGGTLYDRCLINRLTGTVNGNPAYSKDIGNFWGLDFDGTGDYVDLGSAAVLDFENNEAFSALCVLDPNVGGTTSNILSKRAVTGNQRGWNWQIAATTRLPMLILQSTATNRIVITGDNALTNGTDVMLGFTYTGSVAASGVTLYKNGATDADTDTADTLTTTIVATSSGTIGGVNGATDLMNGDIGFVALWDGRALSAVEMRRFAYLGGFL